MKTGLFFGSFNPIHTGHLVIANYMLEFTGLDKLWFVVSPQNPLKEKSSLLGQHHRLRMVREAIADHPKMKGSDIEFKLPQPSYTIDTLIYLEEKYPRNEFVLIMGIDNLQTLHRWKNFEQLLNNYKIHVYPRAGADGGKFAGHPNVVITQAPVIEISSTFIREAVKSKKDVSFFMNPASWQYLREMHFYEK